MQIILIDEKNLASLLLTSSIESITSKNPLADGWMEPLLEKGVIRGWIDPSMIPALSIRLGRTVMIKGRKEFVSTLLERTLSVPIWELILEKDDVVVAFSGKHKGQGQWDFSFFEIKIDHHAYLENLRKREEKINMPLHPALSLANSPQKIETTLHEVHTRLEGQAKEMLSVVKEDADRRKFSRACAEVVCTLLRRECHIDSTRQLLADADAGKLPLLEDPSCAMDFAGAQWKYFFRDKLCYSGENVAGAVYACAAAAIATDKQVQTRHMETALTWAFEAAITAAEEAGYELNWRLLLQS